MKIRRTLALALISLALPIASLSPAHSAVKIGSSCTSAGKVTTVNKVQLICIKSGKRLIWSKVAVATPQISPAPVVTPAAKVENSEIPLYQSEGCHGLVSATLQKQVGATWVDIAPASEWKKVPGCDADHPYQPSLRASIADGTVIRWHVYSPGNWDWYSTASTVKTIVAPTIGVKIAAVSSDKYRDVAAIAQKSLASDMPVVSNLAPVNYTFEDSIFSIERNTIQNGVISALSHYSPFFDAKQTVQIFVFGTSQFLTSEAPKFDPTNKEFADDMARQALTWGARSSSNCLGMGGFAVPEVLFPFIAIDAPCKVNDPAAFGVLPHELTHTLQFSFGNANSRCWAPIWLVEGQAQVGASALAYDENGPASAAHRKSWVDRIVKPQSIADILAMEAETKDLSEYTLGAALSEYLVAKGGWQRSLNLYQQASKQVNSGCLSGSTKIDNFDKAFQSLYGQSLSDFYSEALPYLQWVSDHR